MGGWSDVCVPPRVFLHVCSSTCVPPRVFLHVCSSTCVPPRVFLHVCSNACLHVCSRCERATSGEKQAMSEPDKRRLRNEQEKLATERSEHAGLVTWRWASLFTHMCMAHLLISSGPEVHVIGVCVCVLLTPFPPLQKTRPRQAVDPPPHAVRMAPPPLRPAARVCPP